MNTLNTKFKSCQLNWLTAFLLLLAGLTGANAACTPSPSGLLDWWPGDGNVNDIAGTNNGALMGGAIDSYPGVVGTAFHFNGTNDYVRIPDSPNFHPTNFTIETWVMFDKLNTPSTGPTPGQQYMVFKQNSQSSYFEGFGLIKDRTTNAGGDALSPAKGDIFLLEVTSGTNTLEATGITVIATNTWYHVAATRGSNFIQIYVNGKLDAQTAVPFAQDYGNLPLYFGSSGQPAFDCKLSGALDEVALYNRVLSSNEIAAIYAAGSAGKCRTPPTNVSLTLPGANPSLNFTGGIGQTYGIQDSTNLGGTNLWTNLTNLTLTVSNKAWVDPQPATKPKNFYRVVNGPIAVP